LGFDRIMEIVRVTLKEFDESFITKEYVSWLNDPELMKYSEQRHLTHTIESCRAYFESFKGTDNLLYAILEPNDNRHIGNISAYIDRYNRIADVGILVGKTGRGYGFSAWKKMMKILFSENNVRKITAGAMVVNAPMIKIMKKANMQYEYTKQAQFLLNGKPVDLVGYYILKGDQMS